MAKKSYSDLQRAIEAMQQEQQKMEQKRIEQLSKALMASGLKKELAELTDAQFRKLAQGIVADLPARIEAVKAPVEAPAPAPAETPIAEPVKAPTEAPATPWRYENQ